MWGLLIIYYINGCIIMWSIIMHIAGLFYPFPIFFFFKEQLSHFLFLIVVIYACDQLHTKVTLKRTYILRLDAVFDLQ